MRSAAESVAAALVMPRRPPVRLRVAAALDAGLEGPFSSALYAWPPLDSAGVERKQIGRGGMSGRIQSYQGVPNRQPAQINHAPQLEFVIADGFRRAVGPKRNDPLANPDTRSSHFFKF